MGPACRGQWDSNGIWVFELWFGNSGVVFLVKEERNIGVVNACTQSTRLMLLFFHAEGL